MTQIWRTVILTHTVQKPPPQRKPTSRPFMTLLGNSFPYIISLKDKVTITGDPDFISMREDTEFLYYMRTWQLSDVPEDVAYVIETERAAARNGYALKGSIDTRSRKWADVELRGADCGCFWMVSFVEGFHG